MSPQYPILRCPQRAHIATPAVDERHRVDEKSDALSALVSRSPPVLAPLQRQHGQVLITGVPVPPLPFISNLR